MAGKPRTNQVIRDALVDVPVGASFFLENARNVEIQRIRNVAHGMGIRLTTRRTPFDEVYLAPGVRIWVKEKNVPVKKRDRKKKDVKKETAD